METPNSTGTATQPEPIKPWKQVAEESNIFSLPAEQRVAEYDKWSQQAIAKGIRDGDFDSPDTFSQFKLLDIRTRKNLASDDIVGPSDDDILADYNSFSTAFQNTQRAFSSQKPTPEDNAIQGEVLQGKRNAAFVRGQMVFNPTIVNDPQKYREAILESDAPPDIKMLYAGLRPEMEKSATITRRRELAGSIITRDVADKVVNAIQEGTEVFGVDVGTPQSPALKKNKAGVWSVVDPEYSDIETSLLARANAKINPLADAQYKPLAAINEYQKKYGLSDEQVQQDYMEALIENAPTAVNRWVSKATSVEEYVKQLDSTVRVKNKDVAPEVRVQDPNLFFDAEGYNAAVDKANAPDEAKNLAKEARTQFADAVAGDIYNNLLANRDDFREDYAKDVVKREDMAKAITRYYKDKKDQAWYDDVGEFIGQTGTALQQGGMNVIMTPSAVLGMFGSVKDAEDVRYATMVQNGQMQAEEAVANRTGGAGAIKLTGDVARILPDLAVQMAIGIMSGGALSFSQAAALSARTGLSKAAARTAIRQAAITGEKAALKTELAKLIPNLSAQAADDVATGALEVAARTMSNNPLKGGIGTQRAIGSAYAGLTSAGSTFGQVYTEVRAMGKSPEESIGIARTAGITAGAITGALTHTFGVLGRGGVEDFASMGRKAGEFTIRDIVKSGVRDVLTTQEGRQLARSIASGIAKDALHEGVEEGLDQALNLISQYATNPSPEAQNRKVSDVINESLYAMLLGILAGGIASGTGQARVTAPGITAQQMQAEILGANAPQAGAPAPAVPQAAPQAQPAAAPQAAPVVPPVAPQAPVVQPTPAGQPVNPAAQQAAVTAQNIANTPGASQTAAALAGLANAAVAPVIPPALNLPAVPGQQQPFQQAAQPPVQPQVAPVAAPVQPQAGQAASNLTGWKAQWELAKIAKLEGVDLTALNRTEYADYAVKHGLEIDDSQLRMAASLRNAESLPEFLQRKKAITSSSEFKTASDDFDKWSAGILQLAGDRAKGTSSGEVASGVTVRSGTATSNTWLFFKINQGADGSSGKTHKTYVGFADLAKSLSGTRFTGFMQALQQAGYQGDIKTGQDFIHLVAMSDQIVMHGRTEADADLAAKVAQSHFGSEINFTDKGVDAGGKSYSQIISDDIKQRIEQQRSAVAASQPPQPQPQAAPSAQPAEPATVEPTAEQPTEEMKTTEETPAVRDATKPEQMTPEKGDEVFVKGGDDRITRRIDNIFTAEGKQMVLLQGLQDPISLDKVVVDPKSDYRKRKQRKAEQTARMVAANPQLIRQLGDLAVRDKQPVGQDYINATGGAIPKDYVKEGELYVFKGEEAPAAEAPAEKPVVTQTQPAAKPVAQPNQKLPKELAGAKPRFGYGSINTELSFASDFDKAAYIVAQDKKNSRHDDYMAWAVKASGLTEDQVKAHGTIVRQAVKKSIEPYAKNKRQVPAPFTVAATPVNPSAQAVKPVAKPEQRTPVQAVVSKAMAESLPRELTGAKPRYAFKDKNFTVSFISDFDKAAYIVAQPEDKQNKQHAKYLKWATDASGLTAEQVQAHGSYVRQSIKKIAETAEGGTPAAPKQITIGKQYVKQSQPAVEAKPAQKTAPDKQPAQPSKKKVLFRGFGRKEKGSVYSDRADGPVLGGGKYYAFNEEEASRYGPEIEQVEFDASNALVISSDKEWSDLTKKLGWRFPNPSGRSPETAKQEIKALTNYLKAKGYTAIVVDGIKGSVGDSAKLLKNVFGTDQVFIPEGFSEAPTQVKPAPEPEPTPQQQDVVVFMEEQNDEIEERQKSKKKRITPGEARKAGIAKQIGILGIQSNNPDSVIGALKKIAASKDAPKHHARIAKDLLSVLEGSGTSIVLVASNDPRIKKGDEQVNGWYDPATNTAYINLDGPHELGIEETILHELVHASGEKVIRNPQTEAQRGILRDLQKQMEAATKNAIAFGQSVLKTKETDLEKLIKLAKNENNYALFDILYGVSSLSEYHAHATTSKAFQRFLSEYKEGSKRNFFERFVNSLTRLLSGTKTAEGSDAEKSYATLLDLMRENKGDVRLSNTDVVQSLARGVTVEMDTAFADAYTRGDTEAAQAMVDEAARAAGYGESGYHNTDAEFDTFRPSTSGKFGPGIYWSRTPRMKFGSRVIRAFLKFSNPLVVDRNAPAEYLKKTGNFITGVTQDAMEKGGFDAILASPTENVVRDPSQIKSADPFTFDEAGNLIPLSKRFNPASQDIRYSRARGVESDSTHAELERRFKAGDKDAEQEVKALVEETAKQAGWTEKAYHGTPGGGFTVFDIYGSRYGLMGQGAYFTDARGIAQSYADKQKRNVNPSSQTPMVYEVFLKPGRVLDMEAPVDTQFWLDAFGDYLTEDSLSDAKTNESAFRALEEALTDEGVSMSEGSEIVSDGLMSRFDSVKHIGGKRMGNGENLHNVTIVFNSEQIKSADAFTYDDDGNLIPLSERFTEQSPDIRFSKARGIVSDAVVKFAPQFNVVDAPDGPSVEFDGRSVTVNPGKLENLEEYEVQDLANRAVVAAIATPKDPIAAGIIQQTMDVAAYNFDSESRKGIRKSLADAHRTAHEFGMAPLAMELGNRLFEFGGATDSDVRKSMARGIPSDEKYADAYRRGDTKAAQEMVDSAAKAAGYNVGPVFHGRRSDWIRADLEAGKLQGDISGVFFTDNKELADEYAETRLGPIGVRLIKDQETAMRELSGIAERAGEPLPQMVPGWGNRFYNWANSLEIQSDERQRVYAWIDTLIDADDYDQRTDGEANTLNAYLKGSKIKEINANRIPQIFINPLVSDSASNGVDLVVVQNAVDPSFEGGNESSSTLYVVTGSPSQIKSADAFTFDDSSELIPLSQRFQPDSLDIRYSRARGTELVTRVSGPALAWKKFVSGFRSRGMVSQEAYDALRDSDAFKKANAAFVSFIAKDFTNVTNKLFGEGGANLENFRVFSRDATTGEATVSSRGFETRQKAEAFAATNRYKDYIVSTGQDLINQALGSNGPTLKEDVRDAIEKLTKKGLDDIAKSIEAYKEEYLNYWNLVVLETQADSIDEKQVATLKDRKEQWMAALRLRSEEQKKLVDDARKKAVQAAIADAKNRIVQQQQFAKAYLPDDLVHQIERAREKIDELSTRLTGIKWLMEGSELQMVIEGLNGVYVTRSYEAFETSDKAAYVAWLNEAYNALTNRDQVYDPIAMERIMPLVRHIKNGIMERRIEDLKKENDQRQVDSIMEDLMADSRQVTQVDRVPGQPIEGTEYEQLIRAVAKRDLLRRRSDEKKKFLSDMFDYLARNGFSSNIGDRRKRETAIRKEAKRLYSERYGDAEQQIIADMFGRPQGLQWALMTDDEAHDIANVERALSESPNNVSGSKIWTSSISGTKHSSFYAAVNDDFQSNLDFITKAPTSKTGNTTATANDWRRLGDKILEHKNDVPAFLRTFLGEKDNPLLRVSDTILKQSHLVAVGELYRGIAEIGEKAGWLVHKEMQATDRNKYGTWVPLLSSKDADQGYENNPLKGMYADPVMAKAIDTLLAANQPSNSAFKVISFVVGAALWNVTAGSVRAIARNLYSLPIFLMNSGILGAVINPTRWPIVAKNIVLASRIVQQSMEATGKVSGGQQITNKGFKLADKFWTGLLSVVAAQRPALYAMRGAASMAEIVGRIKEQPTGEAFQEIYLKAVRLGVANDNVQKEAIHRLLDIEEQAIRSPKDKNMGRFAKALKLEGAVGFGSYLLGTMKSTLQQRSQLYGAPDDFTKIMAWLNEMDTQANIHAKDDAQYKEWCGDDGLFSKMPDEFVKKAADNVTNLIQSHSRVWAHITQFKKLGFGALAAPFAAARAEFYRNAANAYIIAFEEMRSTNKKEQMNGGIRFASALMAHLAMGNAIGAVVKTIFSAFADDDEIVEGSPEYREAVRKLGPEYAKNKNATYILYKNGTFDWVDLSFANPFAFVWDSITAARRGATERDVEDNIVVAMSKEILEENIGTFAKPQIALDAFATIRTGYDPVRGVKIWDSQADSFTDKLEKSVSYYMKQAGAPGDFKDAMKILKAANGVEENGRQYKVGTEVGAVFLGTSIRTVNITDALEQKLAQAKDTLGTRITPLYKAPLRNANDVEMEDVALAVQQYAKAHDQAVSAMQKSYKAAETLLRETPNAKTLLRNVMSSDRVRMSQSTERSIVTGKPSFPEFSDQTLQKMGDLGKKHDDPRLKVAVDTLKEYNQKKKNP